MNEAINAIRNRRSTRGFLEKQIQEEELQAILECGIYAPSANNGQPWHFTVLQNKDIIDRLSDGFKELAKKSENVYIREYGNNEKFHVFYNSPTVIFVSGEANNTNAGVDCAAAVENMLIAAESLSLGSCWVGFIAYLLNSEEGKLFIEELGIPEGFKQIHSIALGYKRINVTNAPRRKENTVNVVR